MTTAYRDLGLAGLTGSSHPSAAGPSGRSGQRAPGDADPGHPWAPPRPDATGLHWLTSAFGAPPSAASQLAATLDQHLGLCRHRHGRLAAMACGAESLHRFIAARFVTTLAVAMLVLALALLVL